MNIPAIGRDDLEVLGPFVPLAAKLGRLAMELAGGRAERIELTYFGNLADYDTRLLTAAGLNGAFQGRFEQPVNYVNAPLLAEQRGITVRLLTDPTSDEYRNVITLRGSLSDGSQISVSGTLTGTKQVEKIVEINGYDVEVPFAEHHIVMVYTDRPGIVAVYGKEFGEAGINIAGMQIARTEAGGTALSVLTIDSPAPDALLESVRTAIDAQLLREIDITE